MKSAYNYVPFASDIYHELRRMYHLVACRGSGVLCCCCGREFSRWCNNDPAGNCPNCGAATRHKFCAYYIDNVLYGMASSADVLYVAPSTPTDRWLARRPGYKPTSTDLAAPGVDYHWDLTDLPVLDGSFDLVLCSHVLEHIPDDAKAMSELARVLRPGGVLILQVPYSDDLEHTDEDFSITDPKERERRWGQFDHVRYYGRDISDRLERAGFDVRMMRVSSVLGTGDMHRYGMWDDILFECRRSGQAID